MSATKQESTFTLRYEVQTSIRATPAAIWARLTDAPQFAEWNSTVESLQGPIELGRKLAITVPIAPGRTFSPTVVAFDPPTRMVWQDGFAPMFRGTRTFTILPTDQPGETTFQMEEVFTGLMLPMIKGSLPDFVPVFERYAADLKAACERG
jgi:hypothetical protein